METLEDLEGQKLNQASLSEVGKPLSDERKPLACSHGKMSQIYQQHPYWLGVAREGSA